MKKLDYVQVGTENTTKKDSNLSNLELVTLGLLALAKNSKFFQKKLMQHLYEHDLILSDNDELPGINLNYGHIKWIPFIDPNLAEDKLVWLLNEINHAPDDEKERLVKILSLAYKSPVPEMAAWGFVFNETLGVFVAGHPFNIDRCMEYSQVIVLGPGWQKLAPQSLAKLTSKVSLMTLTRCIEKAKLNIKRLEPEVSSWLLDGYGLELYSTENEGDFKETLAHVQNSGLTYISISEDVSLIALQPSVTGSYEALLAKLTLL